MKDRKLTPEILDELPADDPEAIRSRRDLRWINMAMGNYQWIASQITPGRWLELGAGDGSLAAQVGSRAGLHIDGLDLAPRPEDWPAEWGWQQGDLFALLPKLAADRQPTGLVANLFLHHFTDEQLATIGTLIPDTIERLLICEPARSSAHIWQGLAIYPFINRVTRHDMIVSIEAGFREGELPYALGLDSSQWVWHEYRSLLGAYRLEAQRS